VEPCECVYGREEGAGRREEDETSDDDAENREGALLITKMQGQ